MGPQDVEARTNMLLGACMAGMAFNNAPVGAVHALAYPLGSHFHITHGLSNTVMLPHVVDFNRGDASGYAAGLYAELAPCISERLEREGLGGATRDVSADARVASEVVREIQALQADLGMRTKLTQMGIAAADVPLLTREAMKQTRLLPNNVREVCEDDVRAMYTEAL